MKENQTFSADEQNHAAKSEGPVRMRFRLQGEVSVVVDAVNEKRTGRSAGATYPLVVVQRGHGIYSAGA